MTSLRVTGNVELRIRRLILALLTFGLVALLAELLALGHYEDPWQFVPLGAIAAALVAIGWHMAAGGATSLRALQAVLVLLVVSGGMGVVLHFRGNAEFQLDMNPDLSEWALLTKVLHAKAPPTLAPGVMAQLGCLGLIYTFRHPALRGSASERVVRDDV